MKKYLAEQEKEKEKEKQEMRAELAKMVEANGGEIIPFDKYVKVFERPDDDQDIRDSLNSVAPNYREIDLKQYPCLIQTGKAPLGEDQIWKEQARKELMKSDIKDDLPKGEEAEKFFTVMAPITWLTVQMEKLAVSEKLMKRVIKDISKPNADPEELWWTVVIKYNGFIKNLWEAQTFGDEVTAKRLKNKKRGADEVVKYPITGEKPLSEEPSTKKAKVEKKAK